MTDKHLIFNGNTSAYKGMGGYFAPFTYLHPRLYFNECTNFCVTSYFTPIEVGERTDIYMIAKNHILTDISQVIYHGHSYFQTLAVRYRKGLSIAHQPVNGATFE